MIRHSPMSAQENTVGRSQTLAMNITASVEDCDRPANNLSSTTRLLLPEITAKFKQNKTEKVTMEIMKFPFLTEDNLY